MLSMHIVERYWIVGAAIAPECHPEAIVLVKPVGHSPSCIEVPLGPETVEALPSVGVARFAQLRTRPLETARHLPVFAGAVWHAFARWTPAGAVANAALDE